MSEHRNWPEDFFHNDQELIHQSALTKENIHGKFEIACELAWRDAQLAEAQVKLEAAEAKIKEAPHGEYCTSLDDPDIDGPYPCNCWKSESGEPDHDALRRSYCLEFIDQHELDISWGDKGCRVTHWPVRKDPIVVHAKELERAVVLISIEIRKRRIG